MEFAALLDEHRKLKISDFLGVQPAGRQGRSVDEEQEAADTKAYSGQAFQNEDPSPSF